jgi:hypothetical protein
VRSIPFLKTPPQWDKDGNALEQSLLIDLSDSVYLSPPAGDLKVANLWKEGECQARFRLAWDEQNLYVDVVVDNVRPNQTATDPKKIWQQDCVIIAVDCGNDAIPNTFNNVSGNGYDDNDLELAVALTGEGPVAYKYHSQSEISSAHPIFTDVKCAAGRSAYHIAIPWEHLVPLEPRPGTMFKMNLLYAHAIKPESSLTYWFSLTPGIHGGPKDPYKFATFVLGNE